MILQLASRRPYVRDAGAVPASFAHDWHFCAVRPRWAGTTRHAPGAHAQHRRKLHWALFHLVAGRLTVISSRATHTFVAPVTWLAPPMRGVRDEAGAGGATLRSLLFDPIPALGHANPLERVDWPVAVGGGDEAGWRELFSHFVDFRARDRDALLQARSCAERLVTGHIVRAFASGAAVAAQRAPSPSWLEDLVSWIIGNALDPACDAAAIVARSGFHRSHVARAFRRVHGCGPGSFLRQERLRQAARILRADPEIPIAVVARSTGFGGTESFCRRFRRQFGAPPGAWRRARMAGADDGGRTPRRPQPA